MSELNISPVRKCPKTNKLTLPPLSFHHLLKLVICRKPCAIIQSFCFALDYLSDRLPGIANSRDRGIEQELIDDVCYQEQVDTCHDGERYDSAQRSRLAYDNEGRCGNFVGIIELLELIVIRHTG